MANSVSWSPRAIAAAIFAFFIVWTLYNTDFYGGRDTGSGSGSLTPDTRSAYAGPSFGELKTAVNSAVAEQDMQNCFGDFSELLPPGWTKNEECCLLNTLARLLPGNIYELIMLASPAKWTPYARSRGGRPLGTIGDIGCFSFHYTKNISCGEGGAVSINRSAALANRALVIQEKGTNRYDFLSGKVDRYEWVDVGSSYVPSEISCAVLSAQLEAVAEITSVRLANFKYYLDNLSDLADKGYFRIPRIPAECKGNGHIFFLVFRNPSIRDHFSECLDRAGITAFKHYLPLHSAPAGRKYGRVVGELKVTDCVATGLLRLPVWAGLKREELEKVVRVVRRVCGEIGLQRWKT